MATTESSALLSPFDLAGVAVAATVTATRSPWPYTRFRAPPARALQIADAFALGFFTMTGSQIAERAGLSGLLVEHPEGP